MINEKMLLTLFEKKGGSELMHVIAEREKESVDIANNLIETLGYEKLFDLKTIDVDRRKEQLKDGIVSLAKGQFELFYATEYLKEHPDAKLNGKQVKEMVKISEEKWQEILEDITDGYKSRGYGDFDDETLIEKHFEVMVGIPQEEFEEHIVFWDDEKRHERLIGFLDGQSEQETLTVFMGVGTANKNVSRVIDLIEKDPDIK